MPFMIQPVDKMITDGNRKRKLPCQDNDYIPNKMLPTMRPPPESYINIPHPVRPPLQQCTWNTVNMSKATNQTVLSQLLLDEDKETEGTTTSSKLTISNIILQTPMIIRPNDIFCCVPGRLTLLGLSTKYKITIGEVTRRVNHPEFLNTSLLGAILRKSKNKDGGTHLRESLNKVSIKLPIGRRKASKVTAFTALSEGEAIRLAKDYFKICQQEFPSTLLGKTLVENELILQRDPKMLKTILQNSIVGLSMVYNLLNKDRSPLTTFSSPPILPRCIQEPLTRFSLLTHGFGTLSLLGAFSTLNRILTESVRHVDLHTSQMFISQPFVNNNNLPRFNNNNSNIFYNYNIPMNFIHQKNENSK
uniref:TF_AP-2 domain-containing protein n=1 Tax=Parastrongyloides trichosuri TaxID=131310 RepID=A0A0N5A7C2_PARTI